MMVMEVAVLVGRWMMSIFYTLCPNHNLCYSCVFVVACWSSVAVLDSLILSLVTVSLTVLVSVTGFFLTTTSSLTNGSLVTSASSLMRGTLISVFDFTGPCAEDADDNDESLGGLFSTTSSSWVTGTSIVFFSVI